MRRQPVTLWRHITTDLLKLLLLTTVVLVCVISFAITIKPLADGELSPLDAISFMLFACVPMLAYALPFAAGFAATLVFHRMSQDNELLASHAGGVSHRRILAPALFTGVLLAVVVGLMSDQVIPRFLRNMERLITEDVARLMISRLGQGETVEFGGNMIYADSAQSLDPMELNPPLPDAENVIVLRRAAFANLDRENRMEGGGTAERAYIVVYRDGEIDRGAGSVVTLVAENASVWGDYGSGESGKHQQSFAVPGAFRDDPKFWSFGELRDLKKNPKSIAQVGHWHKRLAFRASAVAMLEDVNRNLRASGEAQLPMSSGDTLVIRAGGLGPIDWLTRPIFGVGDQPVVVERVSRAGSVTRYTAETATIETDRVDELAAQFVTARINLEEVTTSTGSGEAVQGKRKSQTITGALANEDLVIGYSEMSLDELLAETNYGAEGIPRAVSDAQWNGKSREQTLQREIVSKTHQRVAMSAACLVMVLVGATVAMKLREALPLTVYLWAFFPALGCVLVISTGEQLAQQSGFIGLAIMWGSVLGLLGYAIATYKQVALR